MWDLTVQSAVMCGAEQYGATVYGTVRCGVVQRCEVWCSAAQYDATSVRYCAVRYNAVQ